jgi:hypothetical protein
MPLDFAKRVLFMLKIAMHAMKTIIAMTYVWHCAVTHTILNVWLFIAPSHLNVRWKDVNKNLRVTSSYLFFFQHNSRWCILLTYVVRLAPSRVSSNYTNFASFIPILAHFVMNLLLWTILCCLWVWTLPIWIELQLIQSIWCKEVATLL